VNGLIKLMAAKSIFELLFVCVLAVGFYLSVFPGSFRGALDEADAQGVSGWAMDRSAHENAVEVQLFINGRFIAEGTANLLRPDIVSAGLVMEPAHGFVFQTPKLPPGQYEARVYATHLSGGGVRGTLQQIGHARTFEVK
jgi:hypothetical protein